MKAAVYTRYGSPDVIQIIDIEKPVPQDDEVLIEVHAAAVNPLDWHFLRGTPYLVHLVAGLNKPKFTGLGVDVAGKVEAVGKNVTRFQRRDEVFGYCRGAFAEFVCTSETKLVKKPANVTFEQASTAGVAAFTALQGLRAMGTIQPGKKILVNGASGGVGTFAVQITKSYGAKVTGVCGTRNVEMVRSIGADHVIDYTREDYTKSGRSYDLILDCVGNNSRESLQRVLKPGAACIAIGGPSGRWMIDAFARMFKWSVLSWFSNQKFVTLLAKSNLQDLMVIEELMGAGKVKPVIHRLYPLSELPEAIRYLEEGHARGKVVITLARS